MEFAGIGYSEEQIQLLDVASEFCREKSPIAKVRALLDSGDVVGHALQPDKAPRTLRARPVTRPSPMHSGHSGLKWVMWPWPSTPTTRSRPC